MMVTIVDYRAGNLRSVQRACEKVGIPSELSADPERVRRAERIIFPGVGNAQAAMEILTESGLDQSLREALRSGVPILGICLGAQLILDGSEESNLPCLGLLPGWTRRFEFSDPSLKVPHIGWNEVRAVQPHFLLDGLEPGEEFYFVHSFYPDPMDRSCVLATSDYGKEFCCALGRENLFATQFHPEKSGRFGLSLLERFGRWKGTPC